MQILMSTINVRVIQIIIEQEMIALFVIHLRLQTISVHVIITITDQGLNAPYVILLV